MDSYSIHENSTNKHIVEKVNMKNINSGNKETRNSDIEGDKGDLKKSKGALTSTIKPSKRYRQK